ncbi:hypothetical protein EMPS_10397 [Entomortierella parvispora]|uniref:Uncharacterized protein n=1 Tax=Entomortierella parvispora TaxID=205924 RepID=A0A9P3M188_9FUNG|nr:hypothetical protein EMPS_10397 [Entomortierella parvispora]
MDFFAQAYTHPSGNDNTGGSKVSPAHSPRTSPYICEGAGQGYGCEANQHLRRASSGLECDVGLSTYLQNHNQHSHHPATSKQDRGSIGSPAAKTTHQGQSKDLYVSTSPASSSYDVHSSSRTLPQSPALHRRTSVSNPCLLHHTNAQGGGVVRTPVMPLSLSSPRIVEGGEQDESGGFSYFHLRKTSKGHEPTIEESRELHLK